MNKKIYKKLEVLIKKSARRFDKGLKIHNRWCEDGRKRKLWLDEIAAFDKEKDALRKQIELIENK